MHHGETYYFKAIVKPRLQLRQMTIRIHTTFELWIYFQHFPKYHRTWHSLIQPPSLFQPSHQHCLSPCAQLNGLSTPTIDFHRLLLQSLVPAVTLEQLQICHSTSQPHPSSLLNRDKNGLISLVLAKENLCEILEEK